MEVDAVNAVTMRMQDCILITMNIGVVGGEGEGQGGGLLPIHPPTPKNGGGYFSANYLVKFGHFPGKYHVEFENFVNFSIKCHNKKV